jgi:hypothetical protein
MNYLGLDYHKKYSFATIFTGNGEIKKKERLLNRKEIRETAKGYSDLFGKGGLQWSGGLRLKDPEEKMLRGLVETYHLLCKQVKATDSYAGIVPSTYASGGKVWHGKLTKQGNRWLRWAIVEAVIPIALPDPNARKMRRTSR